ncbi:hypothetical protein [Ornithinimicrobium sp. Y1694]|uniref:hypothetical protein n=1 Tax=Ornithinimicrobium sp. Y1694 TaxID=3418590 RepID=UPI003CEFB6D1
MKDRHQGGSYEWVPTYSIDNMGNGSRDDRDRTEANQYKASQPPAVMRIEFAFYA